MYYKYSDIKYLIGKIINKVEKSDDQVLFYLDDNTILKMFHQQDCCESVYLAETHGDLRDLVGSPIIYADERSEDTSDSDYGDVEEWTFYEIRNINASVTLRWVGTSNGYYSTGVDCHIIPIPDGVIID